MTLEQMKIELKAKRRENVATHKIEKLNSIRDEHLALDQNQSARHIQKSITNLETYL